MKKFIENVSLNNNVLVQVFSGILHKEYILKVINEIKEFIPHATIIGSTTDGEINNSTYTTNQVLISISIFDKTQIIPFYYEGNNYYKIGKNIGKKAPLDAKVAIVLSDGFANGEDLINGIDYENKNILVAGGMAGDNALFKETFIFNNDFFSNKGVVGVYLKNPSLFVTTTYNWGWRNIGKKMKITKSYKNIVYEIDNKSPVEIYKKYLGKEISEDIVGYGIEFPLIVLRNNYKTARAILKRLKHGALMFGGNLKEGDIVQFGVGYLNRIIKDMNFSLNILNHSNIESIFVYSCMARRRLFNNKIKKELELLNKFANVSGFYTYGEFFSTSRYKVFYNASTTILALAENETERKNIISKPFKDQDLMVVLFNLIENSTNEIMDLTYKDPLTGLKNKNKLLEDLEYFENFDLVLIDIKKFNEINMNYGFEYGDIILKVVSNKLKNLCKEGKIYRIEADTFAILVKNYLAAIKTIKNYFYNNPLKIKDISMVLTFSFGVGQKELKKDRLKGAAAALKEARKKGINAYEVFERSKNYVDNLLKMNRLIKAIQEDRIVPFYQGIYDVKNKKITKYEVLMRIIEKDKVISPFEFLDIAKVSGLINDLTKIIIDKSFSYMKDKNVEFSINLSSEDLENDEIIDYIFEMSKLYNIKHNRVIFEVLEDISTKSGKLLQNLQKLKKANFQIAIDDFGAEYSNFQRLLDLNVEILKIDGNYIKNITSNEKSKKIVKIITELAKELNIKLVAEFVANEDIVKVLNNFDIDYYQGFLFSEPSAYISF